jgi:hypothetical protein
MAREVGPGSRPCVSPTDEWQGRLKSISFYAYGATVDDEEVFNEVQNCHTPQDSTAHDFFRNRGITLYRTIATDKVVARGIAQELAPRGVEPGKYRDHVALISEWDTFYGRSITRTIALCFAAPSCSLRNSDPERASPWVHNLTYFRGLDGMLPPAEGRGDQISIKGTAQAETQSGTQTQSDSQRLERPFGQGQLDSLRLSPV